MVGKNRFVLGGARRRAGGLGRGAAAPPLLEPRLADSQRPAGGRMRHPMLLPLGGDEGGHRYRPIASSTQRATERLSTSRCIRSSVTSLRSRTSSARSSSLNAALPFSRLRRSPAHQLPSVPSLMPNSRTTCAIGLPVSNTSCTAPCLKSASNFRYCLLIAPPQSDVSTLRGEAQAAALACGRGG